MVGVGRPFGADVDRDVRQLGDVMQQSVVCLVGNVVGGDDSQACVDGDASIGDDLVTDPAQTDPFEARDPRGVEERLLGGRGDRGVDCVHETSVDVASRASKHDEDGQGDQDADDRVGQVVAEEDAKSARNDCQGGEPVRTSMQTVGDQCCRADPASDPDAIDRD